MPSAPASPSRTPEHEVIIVGAGPGGAAAALALAQRGITDVALLDRDPFPRDKTCGSGLSPNALSVLDQLGLGQEVRAQAYPVNTVRLVTPGRREMVLASNAAAVVLLRRVFDNLVVQRAVAMGVTLVAPFRAVSLLEEHGRVVGVRAFDGRELRGRYVLCADGANSIFSRDPRPKRNLATLMGWWEDFDCVPNRLDMIFDRHLAPLYGWMFPEGERRVNIGICVDGQQADGAKSTRNLRATFQRFLDDHYAAPLARARQVGPWKGHPIVHTTRVGHLTGPGQLFLGEAARLTHHVTGEGISQAMQSGIYAAQAVARVLKQGETEERAWRWYTQAHQRRFTPGFVAGHALRALVKTPALEAMAAAYNNPLVRRTVVRLLGSALAGSSVAEARETRPV